MEDIEKFFDYVRKLKRTPRQGWLDLGVENSESVADHSFGTAIASMIYSDLKNLDTGKALRMALLHDMGESIIGDIPHPEKERIGMEKVRKTEDLAVKKILSFLPDELEAKYSDVWQDFMNNLSPESKLVNQVDKLEISIQILDYMKKVGMGNKEKMGEMWNFVKSRLIDSDLIELFNSLREKYR